MADGKRPCKACGCSIEFIEGPNGKPIPVQKVRTIYATALDRETVLEKIHLGEDYQGFYVSHFETCSNPGRFSRAKERPHD
jgi:hypothetical protein